LLGIVQAASTPFFTPYLLFLLFVVPAAASNQSTTCFYDYRSDREYGYRTPPVLLGLKRAAAVTSLVRLASFVILFTFIVCMKWLFWGLAFPLIPFGGDTVYFLSLAGTGGRGTECGDRLPHGHALHAAFLCHLVSCSIFTYSELIFKELQVHLIIKDLVHIRHARGNTDAGCALLAPEVVTRGEHDHDIFIGLQGTQGTAVPRQLLDDLFL